MQKKKSKKVVSFLVTIVLVVSVFSTVANAFYINDKKIDTKDINLRSNFKEKLENLKEKIQTIKNRLNIFQYSSDENNLETKFSSFYKTLSLFSILRTSGLNFHTNYDGMEKNYGLKIFKSIQIDVNNDSVNDFSVRTMIYPGIEFPLSFSFNMKLIVSSLGGYDSLDENAFFQAYAEFYRPGVLFKDSQGDGICFGYESPIDDKIPENIEVIYKFVPNFLTPRKTPEHKLETDLKSQESDLSILFSYKSLENDTIQTEHNLKILYESLKKSSISFGRTGNSSIDFKRDDSTDSYVTLFYEKKQDQNTTYFYVKDVPSHITFTADIGRDGLIEFDTHGKAAEEIGIVDDFENPQSSIYFTNLFSKAGISWHRDRSLFKTRGVANLSAYSDGEDVSLHVALIGSEEGFVDFEAVSHQALDFSLELNLDEGYLRLFRSSVDLSLSLNVEIKNETLGNFVNKLSGSCDIAHGFASPFEILFENLKSGSGQINLAGKSLDISNLIFTGSSPIIGGNFTVSMERLEKEKEGRISFDLSINAEENNVTGSCCFIVENGVKITQLSLLYNDFEFHRENIDVAGDIVRWYNFSVNISVEWHVHKDWGYVLVRSGSNAAFSFNSVYTNETGVLTGIINGIIRFDVVGQDFNISWRKVDGNYTFSFDGSGVAQLKDFNLWIKDKIDVSIPEISLSFEIDTDAKEGSLILYLDDNVISGEINIENINITDVFDITLRCSIGAVLDVSASGFIEINWNESGIASINGDFGADVSGSIDITDFVFKYKTLVDISMNRLFIDGDLNFDFSSTEGNMSIYADVDFTDIVISDLSIYSSISNPLAVSADMDITFNGEGYVNLVYSNDTILLDGAVYDDSDIVINSLWFLVPGLYIEINLESFSINGPLSVLFNVDSSKNIPFMITVISEKEVTADTIYLGYPGIIQIHVYDFVGGGSGGRLGIGLNTATSQPVFDFNHSSCFIGDLQLVLLGGILIPISNLSLSGTARLEGFLDIAAFTYVYLKGVVLEETTITLDNVVVPLLNMPADLSNFSLVLKPGYIDLLLQNTGDIYLYGYSSSWITIKADDKELLKFIGTLNVFMSYSFSDDGPISVILDAKEISAEVIVADSLRFAGEINAHIDFSININNSGDTTTISDLYINVSGTVSAVVQVKGNDTDWIPIIPFDTSGQVVLLCQTALMKAPEITSDFITETDDDNKTLRFEVWYAPPLGEDSSSIGPYTYNVSFGDGTYYEVTTNDNRIVTEPHFYNLGLHTASVTVTPSDSSIDPIYDVLSFEIVKNEVTYLELVDSGPLKFTYADVESDGRIHTWFSFRNKAEENYIVEWEAEVSPYYPDFDFEELDPIVEPETGFLDPGEEQRVNVSIYPPSDHRDHVMQIYPGVKNIKYTGAHPREDSVGPGPIDIRQSFSLFPKGGMYLPSLEPGESIDSSFWIINNKANALNWTISDISNQNYSLPKTEGMIPPGGAEIVYFTVNFPSEEDADLAGKIEVTDSDDSTNVDTVSIIVGMQMPSSNDSNVTVSEDENGNVSIAIGGSNEIHINNFEFEINGVSGAINGHFIFDTQDSYVFINWTKGDLSSLSVDGNAEFSIENFAFSYGEKISIVVSRMITGGLHCSEGRKGNFTLVVDDTFVDVDIDVHFNNSYSNFSFSGKIDIDIDSVTNANLVIGWDLDAETKDISIDGDLLHTSDMDVLITDFVLQFNNFTLNAGLLHFSRTVFISFNETSLTMESGSTIQAEDIYFSLNGDSQLITIDATVEVDGYVTFEFKPWNDGFMFCMNTTGFTVNGWIYVEYGEYHGSAHIFWKIVGWFCIGLETS